MKYLWGSKDDHMCNMCLLQIALSLYDIFQGLFLTTLADGHAQERELVEADLLPTAAYIPSSFDFLLPFARPFPCLLSHGLLDRDMIDEFVFVPQIHCMSFLNFHSSIL